MRGRGKGKTGGSTSLGGGATLARDAYTGIPRHSTKALDKGVAYLRVYNYTSAAISEVGGDNGFVVDTSSE